MANKKKNWLVITAIFLIVVGSIYSFFDASNYEGSNVKALTSNHLMFFLFSAAIFAPVIEELQFRSFYLNNKYIQIIGLFLLILFEIHKHNSIVLPFLLVYIFFFVAINYKFLTSEIWINVSYLINTLLFAISHYTFPDFQHIDTYFQILFQLSAGLLLIWITINHSLIKSVLAHMGWNLIICLTAILSFQIRDRDTHRFETEKLYIEYNRSPLFSTKPNSKIDFEHSYLKVENYSISDLLQAIDLFNKMNHYNQTFVKKKSVITNSYQENYNQSEPFMKYSFKIKGKKVGAEIRIEEVINFLINEKLLAPDGPDISMQ